MLSDIPRESGEELVEGTVFWFLSNAELLLMFTNIRVHSLIKERKFESKGL
jgi:hypothetical protein